MIKAQTTYLDLDFKSKTFIKELLYENLLKDDDKQIAKMINNGN